MKTVIEMAREAGFWREHTDTWMCNTEDIERFAELVRAESLDQPAQVQSPAAKVVELCRLENDSAALTPRIVAIDKTVQIGQMLYTHPPQAQRPWVGLTDEEIGYIVSHNAPSYWDITAAIEAKLKDRNT